MYVVYGLEDPRDHLYHYIGITDDVYRRFQEHITGSAGNIKKNGWIWECRQANIMIIMREIERIETYAEAGEREKFWIWYYLEVGHPLQNALNAKSVVEEQIELERRYQSLLAKKMNLIRHIRLQEVENKHMRSQDAGNGNTLETPATEIPTILELHKQGFSLRAIAKHIGWPYNRVRNVIISLLQGDYVIESQLLVDHADDLPDNKAVGLPIVDSRK